MRQGTTKPVLRGLIAIFEDDLKTMKRLQNAGCRDCESSNKHDRCNKAPEHPVPKEVWARGCEAWTYDEIPF